MKVNSKIYKGIEYVQMIDLPEEQREKFLESSGPESFIKILIGETVLRDCIQYREYDSWFDATFKRPVGLVKKDVIVKEQKVQVALEQV